MNSFFGKLGYSTISVYVDFFIGLIASVLIARALDLEEYGVYSYLIRVAAILIVIINGGVATGVTRFLAEVPDSAENRSLKVNAIYTFFVRIQWWKCFFVLLIFYAGLHLLLNVIAQPGQDALLFVVCLAVVFKSFYMLQVSAFKGLERFDILAYIVSIVCPLYLIVVLLGYYLGYGIGYFIYVYLFISFTFWLVAYFFIRAKVTGASEPLAVDFKDKAKRYVKVVAVNTVLASLVFGYVEVYFLQRLCPIETVGYFNIGLTMSAAAINLVPGVYNSLLMPAIVKNTMKHDGEAGLSNSRRFVFDTIRHMLVLTLLVVIPAAYFSEEIVSFLYGDAFLPAASVLKYMLLVSISTAFIHPAIAFFVSKDKQSEMLKINSAMLSVSIVWAYFLIQWLGLDGALVSYVVTRAILFVCFLGLLVYHLKSIEYFPEIAKLFLSAFLSIVIVDIWSTYVPLSDFYAMATGSIIYALFFCGFIWFLRCFTLQEREQLAKLAGKFLSLRSGR